MKPRIDIYDEYADEYAASVAGADLRPPEEDALGILPRLLPLLGDVRGLPVLDAGCGEGYLSRILARRGARVTGVDLSPRLIELARRQHPDLGVEYRVADLCRPLPELGGRFDVVASRFVLNDAYDHEGYIATLHSALRPGGRLALALNNPYSYVVRRHLADYFATGGAHPYRGMAREGIGVHFYHRTLEQYLDAFLAVGLRLTKLVDLPRVASNPNLDTLLPEGARFPFLMILAFEKPPAPPSGSTDAVEDAGRT